MMSTLGHYSCNVCQRKQGEYNTCCNDICLQYNFTRWKYNSLVMALRPAKLGYKRKNALVTNRFQPDLIFERRINQTPRLIKASVISPPPITVAQKSGVLISFE